MENRVASLEARMTRLEHVVVGNGEPGLDERVRNATTRLDADLNAIKELQTDVKALIKADERRHTERAVANRILTVLIALLGAGGAFGFTRVLAALEALTLP